MFAPLIASVVWWVFGVNAGLLGAAAGAAWWSAHVAQRSRKKPNPPAPSKPPVRPVPTIPAESRFAPHSEEFRQMVQQLSDLTATTSRNVSEHSTQVQSVSDQVSAIVSDGSAPSQDALLAAAQKMLQANQALQAELARTKSELHEHAKRIEVHMAEARTDALAGVANRRALDEHLARCHAAWLREGKPLSLLILDVDHFKRFNDTYGHQAGDEVLRNLGAILSGSARDTDFVARYGGEEFALVLTGTGLEDAQSAAERVRKAVAQTTIAFAGQDLHVTISVGLAEMGRGETVALLMKRADMALYAAKANGRNCCYYHDGKTCRPVDVAAVARRSEVASIVRQQLVEIDRDEWSSDRRSRPRHKFRRVQWIAPCFSDRAPKPEEFFEVQCRDINAGGISFWLPAPPDFASLVVALGTKDNAQWLAAEVSHASAIRRGKKTLFLVGCRFKSKVDRQPGIAPAELVESSR